MNRWRVALVLGVLAFSGATAAFFGVWELTVGQALVTVVGVVALLVAISALSGRSGGRQLGRPPEPERRRTVPVPGDSFHDALESFTGTDMTYFRPGNRAPEGLQAAAVAVLTRFEGDSEETAAERIEDGTWTDDPIAAAFLSESVELPTRSVRDRLASFVGRAATGRSSRSEGIRHTVAAIRAVAGGAAEDRRIDPDSLAVTNDAERGSAVAGDESSGRRRTTTVETTGTDSRARRATGYWNGIGVVALSAVGIGALASSPAVVLAGVVGVGYAGFARTFDPPEPELSLERSLSDETPDPGDEIDVTLTVTNEGDGLVPDLRLVDGVPPGLLVTEGSSRLGTALRPGESVTLEYTVTAGHGSHEFDPALVIARDLSRSTEREYLVECGTALTCEPELQAIPSRVPLRTSAVSLSGRLTTAEAGAGTTFHSVREYRPSDPLSRVDWNRRAKTGEFATLEFHEERAARVVVLVDARKRAYLAPTPDGTHAVDRSVAAAGRIAATLLEGGDTVGLAGLGGGDRNGPDGLGTDPCWLAPGSGRDHEIRFRELLATHPQFETVAPDQSILWRGQLETIRRRLDSDTQIVFLTPLCDPTGADIARRLEAWGHPVTVVSPDPTADRTAGQALAGVARRLRCVDLRRAGIPVIDWPTDETIDDVFARHEASDRL
ncbi:DUF58 domain-containing protein [Halopiger goleimassiliensis]|uniref:DUF58 domain-containing protein n=1 Tax=Halopiger goleimassiliensis TaxID=1293048 RepID=UPI000677601C|nr:DUF58 domain-containing protein [Halopiger goleimassiliensis]